MQRVVRSTLVGLLTLAGLTACGDKVTVPPPTSNPAGTVVHSVTVSPNIVSNLNIGDKITLAASVDADAGVTDRTVTWSSSNPAVATVNATSGEVTAVAGGNTTIIAKSKADPTVSGAASVSVQQTVLATVTVGQINQTICTFSCTSVPANLQNVAGQLDVTLNVDAGTQKIAGVDLIMNCGGADTVVATQNVASAAVAPEAEESNAPVTLSFNTAAFNATNGSVAFKNGACTIKGRVRTTTGTQTASSTTALTLNNLDAVAGTITTTPSTGQNASATDGSGLLWRAGAVNVVAVPVIYSSGITIASASVSLVNGGNDVAIGRGQAVNSVASGGAVATLTNLAPTAGAITANFANDTTTGVASGVGGAVVDTLVFVVNTVTSGGNAGPSLSGSTANFIRLDNRAPDITSTAPTYIAGTQNTAGGWVGKNFVFSVDSGSLNLGSATTDNKVALVGLGANANSNGGVDKITVATQSAPAGSSSGSSSWATFTAVSSLAETASGSTLGVRLRVCDALGNCSTTAQLGTFGVDLTAPGYTIAAGPKNLDVFNIASTLPSNETIVPVDSTLTAGATPSGGNGVLVSIQGLKPSGGSGSATSCVLPASSSACGTNVSLQASSFAFPAGAVASGEYTMTLTPVDQAGNRAVPTTIKYYVDVAAPALSGGVAVPASIAAGAQFTSTATDNMDVAAGNGYLEFTTPAIKILQTGTASPTGVTFDNALTRSSAITVTLSNFYRSMSPTAGTAGTKPVNAGIRAIDAANNLSAAQVVALPPTNIANGSTIPNSGATGITAFTTTIDSAAVAATHTVVLTSTSTPFDAVNGGTPFAQVCFYFSSPTGAENNAAGFGGGATGELIKIGCTGTLAVTQSPRTLVYSMPWTVPAGLASTAVNVFAIGNNSNGDALISGAAALTINAVPTP